MRKTCLKMLVLGIATLAASSAGAAERVVVGSTNFPEQLILANIYTDVLQANGVEVKQRLNLGSREIVFPALKSGEIDVLPEYTGALLSYLTDGKSKAHMQDEVIKELKAALPDNLVMLEPASAQDKDALVVTKETADKYDLNTVSDLKGVASKLIVGGPPEMKTRYVGLPGLKEVYGVDFKEFRSLDAGGPLTTGALGNGDIDVARMFTTQGIINSKGWVVLEDDKEMVPAQNLIPVVRKKVLNDTVRAALNKVSANLTTAELQKMNRSVSVDKTSPKDVARSWVKEHGLAM